jgi:hypothetical protein
MPGQHSPEGKGRPPPAPEDGVKRPILAWENFSDLQIVTAMPVMLITLRMLKTDVQRTAGKDSHLSPMYSPLWLVTAGLGSCPIGLTYHGFCERVIVL